MKMLFGVAVRHVCTKCGPAPEDGGGYIPGNIFLYVPTRIFTFLQLHVVYTAEYMTSDRRPREPDGESRDAPPGARGGVEPGTGYISRSPPRYQENGQLTRGVYRYPTRTTCRVEARRTPHACGCCGRRRTSYTTQASRLTVLAQHASFNPPFPATSPHETERSSSLVGDGVYMED